MDLKLYGSVDPSKMRVTERDEYGTVGIIGVDMSEFNVLDINTQVILNDALNKLASYEDADKNLRGNGKISTEKLLERLRMEDEIWT